MNIASGCLVGPYEVLVTLGAGGMGEVYRARDPRLNRDVALKLLRRSNLDQEDSLDRLLREATLASSLNHPNIVTIYDTGTIGDDRYVVMELVEGTTLRTLAAQPLPVERTVGIARQVAEALAVAHAASVVHRDIKPDNVMVRPDGYVKLLDFGLARHHYASFSAGPTQQGTEPGMIIGTVGYMAPEQARGETAAPEADIFSFGVVLYELLTGRHPFAGPSQMAMLHSLLADTPEPPGIVNSDLVRPLDQLVMEMLQKDPRLRPGAGEVLLRLGFVHDSSVSATLSSVAVAPRPPMTARSIVGREADIDALGEEFARARAGNGRLVVVSGEAGSGKTTVVEAFLRSLEDRNEAVRIGRGRCSERLAGSEAYLPVIELLDSLQHHDQLGSLSRVIRAVAPTWYAQIMPAGSDSSAARLAAETAGGSQERLKREIAALLEEAGRLQPIVLWLDDVHWADASTTDLIPYLTQRLAGTNAMLIVTCRPSDLAQARHPFVAVKLELMAHGLCREIALRPLEVAAIDRYLGLQFSGHAFPAGFSTLIHQRTEGHPLFLVDLLRDLKRRYILKEQDGRWRMAGDLSTIERELPPSVRSLVQRKLESLDDTDRRLLGAASVQGLDFDTSVIAGALGMDEEEVETRLERIEREHALIRFVAEGEARDRSLTLRYRFAHHVYQHAFDESLRITRRAAFARAIAEQLVRRMPDEFCECSAAVALLFETARENIKAAEYFNRAAAAAARLYAHEESARLAQRGLALLASEPSSPARDAAELSLQMTYGLAVKTGRGYAVPEVGIAYARARELCRQVADPSRVVPVLVGLSAHHVVSGEIETSRDVAREMLALFDRLGDPNLRMLGEWSLGVARFHLGELSAAHEHLTRALSLYDPEFHRPRVWETGIEPGVFTRAELSRTLALRGYPDQALAMALEAVAQAKALEHPQPLAFAYLFLLFVYLGRRDPAAVLRTYDQLAECCLKHGIAQELQWAGPLRGRARVEMGDVDEGLREMDETLASHTITRSALLRPYYFVLYAGALLRGRRYDEAQHALDEATRVAQDTAQQAYVSEHHRLQAELHSVRGLYPEAEAAYRRALETAVEQGARWLELRAARGYANYLAAFGRTQEARDLLAPVLHGIGEGFETLDYAYADVLLKSIEESS